MKQLKKFAGLTLAAAMMFGSIGNIELNTTAKAAENTLRLKLQIDNPVMDFNGKDIKIDSQSDNAPIIINNRTFVPVRAIIEALGGSADWDSSDKTAVLTYNDSEIRLSINSNIGYVNGNAKELDVAPVIVNGRTMLPIRFIAENFRFDIDWNGNNKTITITVPYNDTEITTASVSSEESTETESEESTAETTTNESSTETTTVQHYSGGGGGGGSSSRTSITTTTETIAEITTAETNTETTTAINTSTEATTETTTINNDVSSGSSLQTTLFNINGVEFNMILVEGGTFTMGSDSEAALSGTQRANQANEHQVTLSSYLIGETEITQALWYAVMGTGGGSNDYPMADITKPECDEFAERLSQIAHEQGIIADDVNFHIPTEAQWEFAAKGGNLSKGYTYSGSNILSEVGWTSDDGGSAHRIKLKKPNELGIYDMSGNVYEWVEDYAAPYSTESQTNPCNTVPNSNYVKRGGSFYYNDAYRFTSTYRYFYSSTDYTIGSRICLY